MLARAVRCVRANMQFNIAVNQDWLPRLNRRTSVQRPCPSYEFIGLEGFGQIIVSPLIETLDAVLGSAKRREHQYRAFDVGAAKARYHVNSADTGQNPVKQNDVDGSVACFVQSRFAAACPVSRYLVASEQGRNVLRGLFVILYQQDS